METISEIVKWWLALHLAYEVILVFWLVSMMFFWIFAKGRSINPLLVVSLVILSLAGEPMVKILGVLAAVVLGLIFHITNAGQMRAYAVNRYGDHVALNSWQIRTDGGELTSLNQISGVLDHFHEMTALEAHNEDRQAQGLPQWTEQEFQMFQGGLRPYRNNKDIITQFHQGRLAGPEVLSQIQDNNQNYSKP